MARLSREIMQTFTLKNIPNLDICVLAALELFCDVSVPAVRIPFKRPLVVGSGNAIATGRIVFSKKDAVFADESTVERTLHDLKAIDGVVVLSASGAKHAPMIVKAAKQAKKQVVLLTNTSHSDAEQYADRTYVFPKNREPYTYNTSTYMGMILSRTKEDPGRILRYITQTVNTLPLPEFSRFNKFFLVVPEELDLIIRLLNVKFIELFGRKIARDIETFEYLTHATTVVPSDELFITFGKKIEGRTERLVTKNRFHVPLPKNAGYACMMAVGYFIIGKIQAAHPAWFKKNIVAYMDKASVVYGSKMNPIVG
jgi:hypothetical protein